jgi:hypothetical protein
MNFPLEPTTQERRAYQAWFEALGYVLPCGTCRVNFPMNLKAIQYDPVQAFQTRESLVRMIYALHNEVRKQTNKPINVTYDEHIIMYERFRAKECVPNTFLAEGGCVGHNPMTCTLFIVEGKDEKHRYVCQESSSRFRLMEVEDRVSFSNIAIAFSSDLIRWVKRPMISSLFMVDICFPWL